MLLQFNDKTPTGAIDKFCVFSSYVTKVQDGDEIYKSLPVAILISFPVSAKIRIQ